MNEDITRKSKIQLTNDSISNPIESTYFSRYAVTSADNVSNLLNKEPTRVIKGMNKQNIHEIEAIYENEKGEKIANIFIYNNGALKLSTATSKVLLLCNVLATNGKIDNNCFVLFDLDEYITLNGKVPNKNNRGYFSKKINNSIHSLATIRIGTVETNERGKNNEKISARNIYLVNNEESKIEKGVVKIKLTADYFKILQSQPRMVIDFNVFKMDDNNKNAFAILDKLQRNYTIRNNRPDKNNTYNYIKVEHILKETDYETTPEELRKLKQSALERVVKPFVVQLEVLKGLGVLTSYEFVAGRQKNKDGTYTYLTVDIYEKSKSYDDFKILFLHYELPGLLEMSEIFKEKKGKQIKKKKSK